MGQNPYECMDCSGDQMLCPLGGRSYPDEKKQFIQDVDFSDDSNIFYTNFLTEQTDPRSPRLNTSANSARDFSNQIFNGFVGDENLLDGNQAQQINVAQQGIFKDIPDKQEDLVSQIDVKPRLIEPESIESLIDQKKEKRSKKAKAFINHSTKKTIRKSRKELNPEKSEKSESETKQPEDFRNKKRKMSQNRLQKKTHRYWTKFLLPNFKTAVFKWLKRKNIRLNGRLKKLKIKNGIKLKDFVTIFTTPGLKQIWKECFRTRFLHRQILLGRCQAYSKLVNTMFAHTFEDVFETGTFPYIPAPGERFCSGGQQKIQKEQKTYGLP